MAESHHRRHPPFHWYKTSKHWIPLPLFICSTLSVISRYLLFINSYRFVGFSGVSGRGQKSLLRWIDRTKIIMHVLQPRTPSDPVIIPVSPKGISSSNVVLEMVNSVVLLAFVSNKWWNNYSWPSLPLSLIFHCAIRPFYVTVIAATDYVKKKKSRTIHTSRQHAFLPVSDIIIANALVWRFQDDWCQAVLILSRKRWWPFVVLLQSSVGLGCLCILVVGLILKTIQEHEGKPWSPSAPVGQTPATFALGCQGLCKVKQGIKICLFSGYRVSFNRPGNSPW